MLDFLIKVSVVDEFNLDLAEFITGDSRVYRVFEKVRESGNFLFQNGDMYRLRTQLLLALRNYGLKERGHESMKAYQYSAGLYYELHDRLDDALKMYELSGHHTKIRDILLRNARRNPATGFYFELRKYYLSLTEEEIKKEPELMMALSMLHSILMHPEESEDWYEALATYAKSVKGSTRREAESKLAYLKVALPHRGVKGLTEILVSLSKLILSHNLNLPEFSLTSNLPSVMTGGKDFSEWSRHDRELAFSIGKTLTIVLGKYGKGLISEALGESFFEKGENNYETLKLLTRAQLEVENGGKKELEFAIVGTLCRLHLVSGELSLAQSQLESFEKTLEKDTLKQLYGNLEALRCRFYFYENNRIEIQKWMERAPDENEEFFVMERYRYLTKIRGYILNADYTRGLSLLEKLHYYAEQCSRPYLLMETDLLKSIILERIGEEWQELFLKMLDKACEYHFVRVIPLCFHC